ncbi:hypothetical protein DX912_01285 [Lysobacter soli]|uniref:N-acetylmuramoyl-L-alanine amidase domain-containing protein n=1 Tax=Lysobacter soli TaxID=453783 RepID=A0A3D8VJ86_9GAMM|nr:hypothetical protein DX912_01285 [Lysobacter soli]
MHVRRSFHPAVEGHRPPACQPTLPHNQGQRRRVGSHRRERSDTPRRVRLHRGLGHSPSRGGAVSRFVPVGQSTTTPSSKTQRAEIELEIYIAANGYVQNAGFTQNPIPALETGNITGPLAIVLHRTVSTSAASTLSAFRRGIGTHFLIDKDGTTYQCASLLKKTAHVGPIRARCHIEGTCSPNELATFKDWESRMKCHDHEKGKRYPTRYPMNEDSVGIEVVAMYQEATMQWDAATRHRRSSRHLCYAQRMSTDTSCPHPTPNNAPTATALFSTCSAIVGISDPVRFTSQPPNRPMAK